MTVATHSISIFANRQRKDIKSIVSSLGDYAELPETEYTIRRILHGIPEGVHDIWPEQSLPLESNFDYMNGGKKASVSFF